MPTYSQGTVAIFIKLTLASIGEIKSVLHHN